MNPKFPGNDVHQVAGSSTPGHPPTATRAATPAPIARPALNVRKRMPATIAINTHAIAGVFMALGKALGRK